MTNKIKQNTAPKKKRRNASAKLTKKLSAKKQRDTGAKPTKKLPPKKTVALKRKTPKSWYISAFCKQGTRYVTKYYDGRNHFVNTKRDAYKFASKAGALAVARQILKRLPPAVQHLGIVYERVQ